MSIPYITLSLLATAIITLTIERLMRIFFERRRSPFPVFVLSYVFFGAALSLQFWTENLVLVVLLYLSALVLISLNYKSGVIHRLSAIAGSYYILLSTTAVLNFLVYIFSMESIHFSYAGHIVTASLIVYLLVLFLFSRFKNIKKVTANLQKVWLPFSFIPVIHIFYNLTTLLDLPSTVEIYNFLSSLFIAFIIFYLYNHLSKAVKDNINSALYEQEKNYYFSQCQLMQESMENTKSIRHDMKLHLAAVRDFISNDKTSEASDYLDGLIGDIGEGEAYSDTGNIAFDSIINFKLRNASSDNIKVEVNMFIPPVINIEMIDIVTILGNLLDNALDAVANVEDKKIKLNIEYRKGNLIIKMDNTFDGTVKYSVGNDGEDSVISTRKEAGEHGHGIKNIKKSASKYDGHVDISYNGNVFSVGVLLYM